MVNTKGLRCPHCGKPCGFGRQMQEWEDDYAEDVSIERDALWAMINIYCDNCHKAAWTVDLSGIESEKEVNIDKGPLKGKKVMMPSFIKPKKRKN